MRRYEHIHKARDAWKEITSMYRKEIVYDRETRDYYSSQEGLVATKALALLVESPVSKIMANFFIYFSKPAIPTQLFTSEDEAVAWLKTFL